MHRIGGLGISDEPDPSSIDRFPARAGPAGETSRWEGLPEAVERRATVAVEDEPGGEADDAAGAQREEVALAGRQRLGSHQRGDPPAGAVAVVPDLAAG